MLRRGILAMVAAFAAAATTAHAGNEPLCSIPPGAYQSAKATHPEMAFAIAEVEKHGIASWYTDRSGSYESLPAALVAACPESSRLNIVVYGLPNKDCHARESMGGRNANDGMYQAFVSNLQRAVGDRKVLYVLEPDAIGLLVDGGCATEYKYHENLLVAVRTLSQNPNADIYLDIGHWKLGSPKEIEKVANIVGSLTSAGRIKGISINTSNYRANGELSQMCGSFRAATGSLNLGCIIDTSRNGNGPSKDSEWCNYVGAGIGKVPTGNTGDPNVDYYVWIKPPGDSDGVCSGRKNSLMDAPAAGAFSPAFFKSLWNQGVLVKELGMPMIDGTIRPVQNTPTPTPTTATPTANPNATTPTSNSTEDRSNDQPTSLSGSNATPTDESGSKIGAGVVAAPTDDPVFANSPSVTPTEIDDGGQEANTKAETGGSVSAGIVVLACMVGAAVVALVAIVAVRVRQRSMEETKTPVALEPRIHYLSNSPSSMATL